MNVKSKLPTLGLCLLMNLHWMSAQAPPGSSASAPTPTAPPTVRISAGVVRGVTEDGPPVSRESLSRQPPSVRDVPGLYR